MGYSLRFSHRFLWGFSCYSGEIRTISVVKADFKTDLTKARFIFARRFSASLLLCLAGFIFGYALLGFLGRIFAQDVYYPLLSCLGALSAILVYLLGRKLNPSAPLYLVTIFPLYRKKISENTKLSMGLVTGFLILLILLPSLSLGLTLSNVIQNSHPTSQYTDYLENYYI